MSVPGSNSAPTKHQVVYVTKKDTVYQAAVVILLFALIVIGITLLTRVSAIRHENRLIGELHRDHSHNYQDGQFR